MYSLRLLASKNARLFEVAYNLFDPVVHALDPLWRGIGYKRVEKPFSVVEELTKGLLFDCQMCGRCILISTGMSCPMNCPKNIRNGPCGGVRSNGNCEIEPDMRCVWVDAWEGSQQMKGGNKINNVQPPVDHRLKGSSAWLRLVRENLADKQGSAKSKTRAAQKA
jgi:hypothetical protein